jgi:hypothetical protein
VIWHFITRDYRGPGSAGFWPTPAAHSVGMRLDIPLKIEVKGTAREVVIAALTMPACVAAALEKHG